MELREPPERLQDGAAIVLEALEARQLLSGLTIVPTFASNITSDPNAAPIKAAINAGIAQIEANISTPITVPIDFQEGGGLGSSETFFGQVSYSQWRSALAAKSSDANQLSAIANIPNTTTSPDNGSNVVDLVVANGLALGFNFGSLPQFFGTITLNTSICNITRTSINPNNYDLQAVAMHEIDEVLGIGSSLDENTVNNGPIPTDDIDPQDLFRYSAAPGTLDYTTSSSAAVYFSIDGGQTDLARYNQDASGDYNDWYSINGGVSPEVQDAFDTPGVIPAYNAEPVVLDVLGYAPTRTLGTGIVSGAVFNDANGNGVQNSGEANLSGWTIEAIQNGALVTTAQSNALGYQLSSLADGTYTIEAVPQAGFGQTTPIAPFAVTITSHNDTVSGKSFGVALTTVSSINPNTGPTTGGTSVVITGANFTSASAVTFGGVAATSFTVNSLTQITAVDPAGAAGTVDVQVKAPGGTSVTSTADQFTYVAATPNVAAIAPTDGSSTAAQAQRSQVRELVVTLATAGTLTASQLSLEQINTGGSGLNDGSNPTALPGILGAPTNPSSDGVTWIVPIVASTVIGGTTYSDATGSLSDGIYTLGIANATGTTSLEFHRLFGDFDGNGIVNNADYTQLKKTFNAQTGSASYNQDFDYDNNGIVNNADYVQFKKRFQISFSYPGV